MALTKLTRILMLALMGSFSIVNGKEYMGFVVDDTGSMENEIVAVREWIAECVNGLGRCGGSPNVVREWLSISFNDPSIGTLTGPTGNPDLIIKAINGYFQPKSGGDCKEQAMKGLKKLAQSIPKTNDGCKIFFFSDATPKHPEQLAIVDTILKDRDCDYVPILTGCCGPCKPYCNSPDPEHCRNELKRTFGSEAAIPAFYRLAARTASPVHIITKPISSAAMLAALKKEVSLAIARWRLWSSCSVTCGRGITTRSCYLRGKVVETSRCGDGLSREGCSLRACPAKKEYIGLVIDNTSSMKNVITRIIDWISGCDGGGMCRHNPFTTREWLSISFNDRNIGAVTGPTSNVDTIEQVITRYMQKPGDGRDCKRLVMGGIKKLLQSVPRNNGGCTIYTFSDGTPKDPHQALPVMQLLSDKDCAYVPILSGCCGSCPSICTSRDSRYCINELKPVSVPPKTFESFEPSEREDGRVPEMKFRTPIRDLE